MSRANAIILMDISQELAECSKDLQKFILSGKQNFLSYIRVFKSVRKCMLWENSMLVTLVSISFFKYNTDPGL